MSMFTVPANLAECADLLYLVRQERLRIQKEIDELADQERQLKDALIDALPKDNASGIAGKVARVTIKTKPVAQVSEWGDVCGYIKREGAFDLLQRRLNQAAVAERWADNVEIPGVSKFNALEVSCVKV